MSESIEFIYFSDSLPPANNAASARAQYFIQTLQDNNFKIRPISSNITTTNISLIFKTASNKSGFAKRLLFEILSGLELALRILFLQKKSSTYVFLSSPPFITNLIAASMLALRRRPFFLDIRDPYPEVYFQHQLLKANSWLGQIIKKNIGWIYKNALHNFVATEGIQNILLGYGVNQDHITVIKNGFDDKLFRPLTQQNEKFTCIFHGNLGHMQNIDLLIEVTTKVIEKNSNILFVIAGEGPQSDKITLKKNIQFAGAIHYIDLPDYVGRAHLGLSFRHSGLLGEIALPVKVFEYIGCGLPTLISPHGEAGSMVEAQNMGYQFHNNEVEKIVDTILRLASDNDLYSNLRKNVTTHRLSHAREAQAQKMILKIHEVVKDS